MGNNSSWIGGSRSALKILWYNSPAKMERSRSWLSAHAWKACNPQRFAGSNPALSARRTPLAKGVFLFRLAGPHMGMISESRPLRQKETRFLCKTGFLLYLGTLMKSVHIPRPLILLILVIVAFLIGVLRVFGTAHAAASTAPKVNLNGQADVATDLTPTPVPTNTGTDLPPQSTPVPVPASADTTGIIALAIVIVTTILVGAAWGVRRSPKKKTHPK